MNERHKVKVFGRGKVYNNPGIYEPKVTSALDSAIQDAKRNLLSKLVDEPVSYEREFVAPSLEIDSISIILNDFSIDSRKDIYYPPDYIDVYIKGEFSFYERIKEDE